MRKRSVGTDHIDGRTRNCCSPNCRKSTSLTREDPDQSRRRQSTSSRRRFIRGVGAATIASVAGCSSLSQSPDSTITVQTFVETPEGREKMDGPFDGPQLEIGAETDTLADIFDQEGVHYGSDDIQDIFDGVFAVQQNGSWVFFRNEWRIQIADRDERFSVAEINNVKVNDGDEIELVYHREEIDRQPQPDPPDFIEYISTDAPRNGEGDDDYLSCENNQAVHRWAQDYQAGRADRPDYPNTPPVCGAHVHEFPPQYEHQLPHDQDTFILEESIDPVEAVPHILGHGMMLVSYAPTEVANPVQQELERWTHAHPFVYLAPDSQLTTPIVLTRWGMRATVSSFETEQFERFKQAPYRTVPPMHGSVQYYHTLPHLL